MPFVSHSSVPCVPSFAVKTATPADTKKFEGLELPEPGLISANGLVPAAVPLVT